MLPIFDEHRITVLKILQQIRVSQEKLQNMIDVLNKVNQFIFPSTKMQEKQLTI